MDGLPRLSPKQQVAVAAFKANGGDKEAAYLTAFPASMNWKPETVKRKADDLFKLKAVIANVKGKRPPKPKRVAKTKGMRAPSKTPRPPPPVPKTKLTPEVRKIIATYADDYARHHHPYPSVVGLAAACKVSSQTIYEWSRNPDHAELSLPDVLRRIENNQHMKLIYSGWGAEQGTGHANITKMMLGRKHGYEDIQRIEHTGRDGGAIQTASVSITSGMPVDEATKLYRALMRE